MISTLYCSAADAVNSPIGVTRPDIIKVASKHTASKRSLFIILVLFVKGKDWSLYYYPIDAKPSMRRIMKPQLR